MQTHQITLTCLSLAAKRVVQCSATIWDNIKVASGWQLLYVHASLHIARPRPHRPSDWSARPHTHLGRCRLHFTKQFFTNKTRLKADTVDHHAALYSLHKSQYSHYSCNCIMFVDIYHLCELSANIKSRRRMSAGRVANTAKATRAFLVLIHGFIPPIRLECQMLD